MTNIIPSEAGTEILPQTEYAPGGNPDWEQIGEARRAKWAIIEATPLSECLAADFGEGGFQVLCALFPNEEHGVASDYYYPYEDCGSRLEKAWQLLTMGKPAKWKTVGMLTTLRQALREMDVQMTGLEIPREGASEKEVRDFLLVARVYDTQHHGEATF